MLPAEGEEGVDEGHGQELSGTAWLVPKPASIPCMHSLL
jgi:hypothetical protein